MLYKKIITVCLCLTLINQSDGQVKALNIGDRVPDLLLRDIVFHKQKSLRLSELKGKLIILDFWSTSCSPCIKAMPKMDSLQKKFGDKIAIIPVIVTYRGAKEYETRKKKISDFWKKNPFLNRTSLPTVIDTSGLEEYFPHEGVPCEVWINGEGTLVGLTRFVNENEIASVLNGNLVNASYNNVGIEVAAYNYQKNLLIVDRSQPVYPSKVWYTVIANTIAGNVATSISDYRKAYTLSYSKDSSESQSSLKFINVSVESFYRLFLRNSKSPLTNSINLNKWIWNVKDPSKFISPSAEIDIQDTYQWRASNRYSYEAFLPGIRTEKEMYLRMKQDVDDFFGLDARVETRSIDCWVLSRTSSDNKLLFSTKKDTYNDLDMRQGRKGTVDSALLPDGRKAYLTDPAQNYIKPGVKQLTVIINDFNSIFGNIRDQAKIPVIDETGITTPIAIALEVDIKDFEINMTTTYAPEKIKDQLKQYGIELIKTKREMEVFVITEKGYKAEGNFK